MTNALECVACGCQDAAPGSSEAGWPVCSKCFNPMVASSAPKLGGTEAEDFNASLTMIVRPPARGPQSSIPTNSAVEPSPAPHEEEFNPDLTSIIRPSAGARWTSSASEAPAPNEAISSSKNAPVPTTGNKDDDFSSSLTSIIRPGAGMPPSNRDTGASGSAGSVDPANEGGTLRATRSDGGLSSDGSLRAGDLLDGRYLITKRIGQGGMGVVYKAVDQETESELAIKVLLPSLASSPAAMNDLRKEVAIAQQLTHQNLLRVNHLGIGQGFAYLVMEYIDGEDLETYRLRHGGKLPTDVVRRIMAEVLAGLNFLHDRGIVHLDIKPQNIMIPRSGEAKLADFGISRTIRQQVEQNAEGQTSVGTLCFMAPEQIRSEVCDRRTDLYAVGVMLYLLLIGEFPFSTRSREDVVTWHLDPQIDIKAAPPAWDAVLRSCLARRKEEREADGKALISAISSITGWQERTAHPGGASFLEQDFIKRLYDDNFEETLDLAERLLLDDPSSLFAPLAKTLSNSSWDTSNPEIKSLLARFVQASNALPDNGSVEALRVWASTKLARRATILASELDIAISHTGQSVDLGRTIESLLVAFNGSVVLSHDIGEELRSTVLSTISRAEKEGFSIPPDRIINLTSNEFYKKNFPTAYLNINFSRGDVSLIDMKMHVYLDSALISTVSTNNGGSVFVDCATRIHTLKLQSFANIPYEMTFEIDLSAGRSYMVEFQRDGLGIGRNQIAQAGTSSGWSNIHLFGTPGKYVPDWVKWFMLSCLIAIGALFGAALYHDYSKNNIGGQSTPRKTQSQYIPPQQIIPPRPPR